MTITERIFDILNQRHMTQAEFCRKTGISTSAVSDWRHKNTMPSADKIMIICKTLEVTPEELLKENDEPVLVPEDEILMPGDREILMEYHEFTPNQQKRLLSYMKRIRKGTDEKK